VKSEKSGIQGIFDQSLSSLRSLRSFVADPVVKAFPLSVKDSAAARLYVSG
jgi:hypothetical protein